jgi:hypothetical protein
MTRASPERPAAPTGFLCEASMDHAAGQGVLIWVNAPPAKRINLEMSLLLFGRKPGCPISRALRRI